MKQIDAELLTDKITPELLRIRVHHIGGIGDCGPTEVINQLGKDASWIMYDADKSSLSKIETQNKYCMLINRCIGKKNEKSKFYVVRAKSASSILKSAPSAEKYTLITGNGRAQIWGEHTKVTNVEKVEIYSLDSLYNAGEIPSVDFLSIDAQGAELDILNGASKILHKSTIGVLCEVAFSEIYKNQALFCDIQKRLKEENFRLCKIYNNQYWNTEPYNQDLMGSGCHIVGEAFFFKIPSSLLNLKKKNKSSFELVHIIAQSLKLAAIAVVFDQLDLALGILKELEENNLVSLEILAKKTGVKYIKLLRELNNAAKRIMNKRGSLIYESSNFLDRGIKNSRINQLLSSLKEYMPMFLRRDIKEFSLLFKKRPTLIDSIYKRWGINISKIRKILR